MRNIILDAIAVVLCLAMVPVDIFVGKPSYGLAAIMLVCAGSNSYSLYLNIQTYRLTRRG